MKTDTKILLLLGLLILLSNGAIIMPVDEKILSTLPKINFIFDIPMLYQMPYLPQCRLGTPKKPFIFEEGTFQVAVAPDQYQNASECIFIFRLPLRSDIIVFTSYNLSK